MSYPKKIIKIEPSGYNPEQPAQDATEWEVAMNMTSSAGVTVTVPGWSMIYGNVQNNVNNANTIMALDNVEIAGANYWVYHTPVASWVVTGNTHSNVTNAWSSPATDPSYWTSGILNGIPFVNNRLDPPKYWSGNTSDTFKPLPDWDSGTRCRRMINHKNYLFALGIEDNTGIYPEMLKWSDAAAPGQIPQSWTASASTDAGEATLAESGGELISAVSLRDILLIYKQNATYSCRFIGGNEIFKFDTLFTNKGAMNSHSVVDINGGHFVVGSGDIYISDGAQYKSVADGKVKSILYNQLTSNTVNKVFVTYKPSTHTVQINYPSFGSEEVDTALEYNLNDGKWGIRDLSPMNPSTASSGFVSSDSDSQYWNDANTVWDDTTTYWNSKSGLDAATSLVYGGTKIYRGDYGNSKDGSDLEFVAMVTNIDFEDASRIKYVKALYPSIYGEPGTVVNFRIGSAMSVDGTVTWTNDLPFVLGTDNKVECRVMGKCFNIQVTTKGQIMINNISLEADMRGYR